jgi:hypothetical protein
MRIRREMPAREHRKMKNMKTILAIAALVAVTGSAHAAPKDCLFANAMMSDFNRKLELYESNRKVVEQLHQRN